MKSFFPIFLAFAASSCYASMEELSYTVEEVYNSGEFERRNFATGQAFACTNASYYNGNPIRVFLALKKYIDGDNDKHMIIPMTLPVFTVRHLDNGNVVEDRTCLYLGKDYAQCAPTPNSPYIEIRHPGVQIAFTRQIGGFMTASSAATEYTSLKALLIQNGLGNQLETKYYAFARYNAPGAQGPRRNEVWIFKASN
ncbi:hypothetical protein TCAL_15284 [Tigriopus californicus]|uniref:Uncharacterized protein n=1 Tax=Tigriopus californicus TaxID=6832 RepID=A0A553PLY0_TIGCA|nr:heme-binding protein 2-like [Tigriopus californicus]TRY78692.1 hypothetical protein TCAL_15284 [Tigriopus californicus]